MKLGIFSKTFIRPTLEETIAAVAAHGLESIQFNWETAGLDDMPTEVPAAISGTFNIIHPTYRQEGMRRLSALAKACSSLGTQFITLCTGTRDDDYLWRYHADNSSPAAWSDMLNAMREAVEIASDHLKVVIDGANLFHQGELPRMHEILDEAFQLLGDDILLAHGKDLERDGDAGTGVLDYAHYLHCLEQIGFKGTIALHSLSEEQTPTAITHMQKNWPH